MKTNYIFGTVSSGTMREEDLIPAFLDALEQLDPERAKSIRDAEENKEVFDWLENPENDTPEAVSYMLNEDLFDALNNAAPPYFYFGSHPGDGADYGFWLCDEAIEEFDGLKVADLSEVPADYSGEVLHVNDHGNTSLYSSDSGKLTAIWEIV